MYRTFARAFLVQHAHMCVFCIHVTLEKFHKIHLNVFGAELFTEARSMCLVYVEIYGS